MITWWDNKRRKRVIRDGGIERLKKIGAVSLGEKASILKEPSLCLDEWVVWKTMLKELKETKDVCGVQLDVEKFLLADSALDGLDNRIEYCASFRSVKARVTEIVPAKDWKRVIRPSRGRVD